MMFGFIVVGDARLRELSSDSLEYLFRFAFLSLSVMIGRNLLVTKTKTKIFEKKYFSGC